MLRPAGRAAGTIALGIAALLAETSPAATAAAAPPQEIAQAGESRRFAVPAQPLAAALDTFAEQAGISFAYRTADLAGKRSPGVSGTLPVAEALRRLLAGSGVTYRFSDAGVVTLRPAGGGGVLEMAPITVTGEKVERSYLDTFSSVGIATQEDIETYGIDDLHDSFNTMANVRLFSSNRGNNGFQIRGVNSDGVSQPSSAAPTISVIIDGVTQSKEGLIRGSRGTWDVRQVEVLRGPQSTLQGRNALAGAVIVQTNDPTYETELNMKLLAGDLDRKEGAFTVSTPLIEDQLALRLSGEVREQVTDIAYTAAGNEPFAEDNYRGFRGKLLIEPKRIDPRHCVADWMSP